MIQLPILVSLAIGGLAGAAWREYKQAKAFKGKPALSGPGYEKPRQNALKAFSCRPVRPFDDVAELTHYQRVSWYALAFSASGFWFFPPVALISVPLLTYNAYYFVKMLRHSHVAEQKSALTVFESIGVSATLLTGRLVTTSILMLFSFGMRKLQLHGGNMVNVDLARSFNPQLAKVWVLRDGAEIEVPLADLHDGETVVLHAGDTVIKEGTVVEGSGIIRQYSLQRTMKSIPKQSGDKVFPFTYLESGCLYIQVS